MTTELTDLAAPASLAFGLCLGTEDSSVPERCLTGGLPEFGGPTGSFRRIVQTPGGISIFYDVGQGQGWQRNIVMDRSPRLPANANGKLRREATISLTDVSWQGLVGAIGVFILGCPPNCRNLVFRG